MSRTAMHQQQDDAQDGQCCNGRILLQKNSAEHHDHS